MIVQKLQKAGVIHPPKWLPDNIAYLTIMGSAAYGVNNDDSDQDLYGFCIPPKGIVFPHSEGVVFGFGDQGEKFDQWQEHHIRHPDDPKREYDFSVYNIVKYLSLVMQNNPNMIDSLFTPANCVVQATPVGQHVRERRRQFLHKGAWHKFKGYAFAQMGKIKGKVNSTNPKRAATIEQFGYDVKFAYHIVRLMNEVEQIMIEGDLDLLRSREQLKSIRRGEWTLEQLEQWFAAKEAALSDVYLKSTLPYEPDEKAIKAILMECLEMHYGSLDALIARDTSKEALLLELQAVLSRHGG